jgi:hypothetical protein
MSHEPALPLRTIEQINIFADTERSAPHPDMDPSNVRYGSERLMEEEM